MQQRFSFRCATVQTVQRFIMNEVTPRGGPRSAIGKARSSQNATKHGLLAATPVLTTESRVAFDAFTSALMQQLAPVGAYEELLASRVAEAAWRLRRFAAIEVEMFTHECERLQSYNRAGPGVAFMYLAGNSDVFTKLARYEAAIERIMHRSRAELLEVQRFREIADDPLFAMFDRQPSRLAIEDGEDSIG
jgi:hypothetical protein